MEETISCNDLYPGKTFMNCSDADIMCETPDKRTLFVLYKHIVWKCIWSYEEVSWVAELKYERTYR